MASEQLTDLTNKRITLNLLIQGAGDNGAMEGLKLAEPELRAISPELPKHCHLYHVYLRLSRYCGADVLVDGNTRRFWARVRQPNHPFSQHPFLVRHGATLAEGMRRHVMERARAARIVTLPLFFDLQFSSTILRLARMEGRNEERLEAIAQRAAARIWGIDAELLHPEITQDVAFGELRQSTSYKESLMRKCAVGYGGVLRTRSGLAVVAKGQNWILTMIELGKGTAELVCMHGMNTLDTETWNRVRHVTDRLDLEIWCIHAGSELWRRVAAAMPPGSDRARTLMRISLLSPDDLETLMVAVMEDPRWARQLMHDLPERVGD